MKTVFVSDPHIGHPKFHAPSFLRFLESCRDKRVVLLGDVFDLWRSDIYSIFWEFPGLVKEIWNGRIYWVFGNHDEKIRSFRYLIRGVGEEYFREENIVAFHGHQLDQTLDQKQERLFARIVCWIAYRMRYIPGIQQLEHWVTEGTRDNGPYKKKLSKTRVPGCVYIFGHTHRPEIFEDWFVNCGSWGIDQDERTYVEMDNGKFELKVWRES